MEHKIKPMQNDGNGTNAEEVRVNGLLTSADVAKILNIHINTVRTWSDSGVIRSFRIGPRRDRRFTKEEVYKFLAE